MVGCCEFLIVCIQLDILAELFNNNFCVLEISFVSPGTHSADLRRESERFCGC
jgi:hypothetical protein